MKLEIPTYHLGYLLLRLHWHGYDHRKEVAEQADRQRTPHPVYITAWTALALQDYSLCALTPDEFMAEVEAGKRCPFGRIEASADGHAR